MSRRTLGKGDKKLLLEGCQVNGGYCSLTGKDKETQLGNNFMYADLYTKVKDGVKWKDNWGKFRKDVLMS